MPPRPALINVNTNDLAFQKDTAYFVTGTYTLGGVTIGKAGNGQ